jgi:small-conductance mechanosensitive channel
MMKTSRIRKLNSFFNTRWLVEISANEDGFWVGIYFFRKIDGPGSVPGAMALALIMAVAAIVISNVLTRLLTRFSWVIGRLGCRVDETVVRYTVRIKSLAIFIMFGLFYASLVPGLRGLVSAMMAGAGITALVVGFAAKSTLANLISVLSLAVYRLFRIGDKVDINGEYETVEDITLRHTIVLTWQHKRHIIPNEIIDNMTPINYSITDPVMLCTVEVDVSKDSDIDLARSLILKVANNCPYFLEKANEPWVRVISHGEFSVVLRLYVWVPDIDSEWMAKFWLLETIKKRFDREGIELPFPYRTLVYKNDLSPPRQK